MYRIIIHASINLLSITIFELRFLGQGKISFNALQLKSIWLFKWEFTGDFEGAKM